MVEVYSALILLQFFLEKVLFLPLNTSTFPTCLGSLATCEVKANVSERASTEGCFKGLPWDVEHLATTSS